MASTYSNLKIQLMATGENATTWGDVTNINLGTAIEEAIAGSADVTFASANVTLTLTNTNTTQAARNMRLRCTGTTGGSTRNLVVPSIEKPYVVQNDCADSILVKTSAGTGVTVPAGKTMWIYVDGTNVVDAVTHLSSLTLNAPLAVAQGGTGANTAANARTNLGLGSLATASSVNLANQVTDVLPVVNGGTGANTASGARTNLGLDSMATQSSSNVSITGGNVGGVTINANITANTATITPTELSYLDGVTSNIQTQLNAAASSIPSGTKMLFAQTNAPTGWTKDTTHDNKALRVVSGAASTGGSVPFTTAFASQAVSGTVGNTTLTVDQIPSHTHAVGVKFQTVDAGGSATFYIPDLTGSNDTTTATGGGQSHTHSFTGTAIDLAVQYVDVIIATKN